MRLDVTEPRHQCTQNALPDNTAGPQQDTRRKDEGLCTARTRRGQRGPSVVLLLTKISHDSPLLWLRSGCDDELLLAVLVEAFFGLTLGESRRPAQSRRHNDAPHSQSSFAANSAARVKARIMRLRVELPSGGKKIHVNARTGAGGAEHRLDGKNLPSDSLGFSRNWSIREVWCTHDMVQKGAHDFTVSYSRFRSSDVYSSSGMPGVPRCCEH
jgi:hypothetical protein